MCGLTHIHSVDYQVRSEHKKRGIENKPLLCSGCKIQAICCCCLFVIGWREGGNSEAKVIGPKRSSCLEEAGQQQQQL